ncbi:MAG: CopG family ribbon-helix-helix protein [Candidatus Hodarchaeales archaeon]
MPVISISVDGELLKELSEIIRKKNYQGRSEAIRDAIRNFVEESRLMSAEPGQITAAIIAVYGFNKKIEMKLVQLRHSVESVEVEALHRHLGDQCLDLFIAEGPSHDVFELITNMEVIKGIHVRYVLSSKKQSS